MIHANSKCFLRLADRAGITEAIALDVWKQLTALYGEPIRSYHNLHHVEAMLIHLEDADPGNVGMELAIWFHDVIYDPRARDNEARSAAFFEDSFGQFLSSRLQDEVSRLILATDHSQERSGRKDEDLMRDIDLLILAASPADYLNYCQAIRLEYSHVPETDFALGRRSILMKFLDSPIFHSPGFAARNEDARRNICAELERLGAVA